MTKRFALSLSVVAFLAGAVVATAVRPSPAHADERTAFCRQYEAKVRPMVGRLSSVDAAIALNVLYDGMCRQ